MNHRNIGTDRQFREATGVSLLDFKSLVVDFEATYLDKHGQTYENYVSENVTETPKFKNLEDALFFVLFQQKNGLIWGALGAAFEMSLSAAHKNFQTFSSLLELTLEKKSHANS